MTVIDPVALADFRAEPTDERAIGLLRALVTCVQADESPTPEEDSELIALLGALNAAEEVYATLGIDLYVRAGGNMSKIVDAVRDQKDQLGSEVTAWTTMLRDSLFGDAKSRTTASFYGDRFTALDKAFVASLPDGVEVAESDAVNTAK